jgi:hypothetical protein
MSLAKLMIQSASQNIRDTKSDPSQISKAYSRGAQIALQRENLENQRSRIQQMQMQVEAKGVEQVMKAYQNADKFKSEAAAQRYIKYAVPAAIKAYNLEERFTPEMQEMLQGSREARDAANLLIDDVRKGNLSLSDGLKQLNMNGLADYAEMRQMQEASEFAESEKGKDRRVLMQAGIRQQAEDVKFSREGERRRRAKAGDLFETNWTNGGGESGARMKIQSLKEVRKALANDEFDIGTWPTKVPFGADPAVLAVVNPKLAAAVQKAQAGVELRKILGGAFTQAEADRELNRILNPRLSKEANLESLDRYIKKSQSDLDAQVEEFTKMGFIGGELSTPIETRQAPGANEENVPAMSQEKADKAIELIKTGNYGETPLRELPGEQIKELLMGAFKINAEQADNLIKKAGVKSGRNSNLSK